MDVTISHDPFAPDRPAVKHAGTRAKAAPAPAVEPEPEMVERADVDELAPPAKPKRRPAKRGR